MAEFKSAGEKKKWDSLQNQAGHSLQQIAQGRATSADFQRVSNTLAGLNKLAQQVFDEAVSAAEVQAKKFQAQYDQALTKLKTDEQAKDLTAYEAAINKVLLERNPDLIQAIHEAITLELFQQSEDLEKSLGGKFDSIKDLLPPKDLPTVDDTLAASDLLVERLSDLDDTKWGRRSEALLDKIGGLFRDTLREVAEAVQRARSSAHTPQIGRSAPRLGYAGASDVMDVEDNHPLSKAMALIAPTEEPYTVDNTAPAQTSMASGTLAKNNAENTIQMSQHTESTIAKAAQDQTDLYSQLMGFLKNPAQAMADSGGSPGYGPNAGKGAGSGQEKEESEGEKADTWWRSFRNWMGDKYDAAKDWNKENKGWLSGLGTLLSAMLLDPQLFENIGNLLGKYLTWDNIKDAAGEAWHFMLDKGKDIVSWVQDKLGLNKPLSQKEVDDAKTDGGVKLSKTAADRLKDPKVQAALAAQGDPFKDKHPGAKLPDNPDAGGHSSFMSKVSNLFGFTAGSDHVAVDQSVTDTNTTIANGGSPTLNRSGLGVAPTANGPTAVAADGKPMSVTPGVTAQAPGTAPLDQGGQAAQSGMPSKGSPQISMSSFKFHSSVDDSLPMMNTTFFTG